MSFKELNLKKSYISCGEENIASAFLNPALKYAKNYKRSVGFFSSGVFEPLIEGITAIARNKGTIQLIASPHLSEDDIDAINKGYELREKILEDAFSKDFVEEVDKLDDIRLKLLIDLIAKGILDIKIAITETSGMYHDKLGILEDFEGNQIVFYGSPNSSISGYKNNYEKIRLVRSWNSGEEESVEDEVEEFDALWNNTNSHVKVYEYKETAHKQLITVYEKRKSSSKSKNAVTLRPYQETAINKWKENGYKGFYVMATGTGKTWTAIFSAQELLKEHPAMIVICAPYKHLVKQWAEDVEKMFPAANLILVSSENPKWEQQISSAIIQKTLKPEKQIIIISTISSFGKDKFENVVKKSKEPRLLIVDEAHNFKTLEEDLKEKYIYRLGLSATPFSGTSAKSGIDLMNFFGGEVFNLPIEDALDKGFPGKIQLSSYLRICYRRGRKII